VDAWPLMLVTLVLACVGLGWAARQPGGRAALDRVVLKLPVLGHTLRMVSITRFCRILGTMLSNGVPILQALAISRAAAGNVVMAAAIERAAENVRAGDPLADPLRAGGLFPAEIVEMIAVAEETNQLDKVLNQIADTVERRTNQAVDQAVRMIEPAVLTVMAAAIGFLAVGLLYPMFTMSQTMR
jgi:general secretion pathway protein F